VGSLEKVAYLFIDLKILIFFCDIHGTFLFRHSLAAGTSRMHFLGSSLFWQLAKAVKAAGSAEADW